MAETNKIEEIVLMSFPEALRAMKVGETKYAPRELAEGSVKLMCYRMKEEGYLFRTMRDDNGRRLVTRIR